MMYGPYDIFEKKRKLEKITNWKNILKGSCQFVSDQDFSFKYFLKIAFVREVSPK